MKKLITIITLLMIVSAYIALGEETTKNTPCFTAQAYIQGKDFSDGNELVLEVPPQCGFSKVGVQSVTKWPKTPVGPRVMASEPEIITESRYPVFLGLTDELNWTAMNDMQHYSIWGELCDFAPNSDLLNVYLNGKENIACNPYSIGSKSQEMSANTKRLLMFLRAGLITEHTEDYDWFPLDLYVEKKNDKGEVIEKHLICHLEFNFKCMELPGWLCQKTAWQLSPPSYYNVAKGYNVEVHSEKEGYNIFVKELHHLNSETKKFYMSDFFIMFRDIDNPFDKFEIRPRGKIGENKICFDDGKTVDLCNIYGTSKSDFLKSKYYTTTDELLSDFGKPGCNTEMDITIYNDFPNLPPNDNENMDTYNGSMYPGNDVTGKNTINSWDACKGTHFPVKTEEEKKCNYKWVHLFANSEFPDYIPALAYDIFDKVSRENVGSITLYFTRGHVFSLSHWWLDSIQAEFKGNKAQIGGGPGFLRIPDKPYVINFIGE